MPALRRSITALLCTLALAARASDSTETTAPWSLHFQQTLVGQYHPPFSAPYAGGHSLASDEGARVSITSTFFLGRRLWAGAGLYVNPELSGGDGLSGTSGIAAFPNGETFRIGDPTPAMTIARAYVSQTIDLWDDRDAMADDCNQLAGKRAAGRLTITLGKFSVTDFFDKNAYADDPRTQFLNWALMANGAWDYPANTRGYTWGLVAECAVRPWAVRAAVTMVPTTANGSVMDERILRAQSTTLELERAVGTGAVRVLAYLTQAQMGNYDAALGGGAATPDVTATRVDGRTKYGVGVNVEQSIAEGVGLAVRAGWSDGRNETWAFTEIDRGASVAVALNGARWNRTADNAGAALIVSGLSHDHAAYLAAGGQGFIIGDGALREAPETVFEAYYALALPELHLALTPDYQYVVHPAYNADRGPVHVFALRAHVAW